MAKVFLHIGLPKTGSTTIQGFLTKNRQEIARRGFLYPCATGLPTSKALVSYAAAEGSFSHYRLPPKAPTGQASYREWLRDALLTELAERDSTMVVFSDETLGARLRDVGALERLRELLIACGSEITIICYLRRQDELALSLAWNYVLEGSPTALVFPPTGKALGLYDYYSIVSLWAQIFRPENIRVRRFGPAYHAGGDVLSDFLEIVGIDATGLIRPAAMNRSPSAKNLEFLERLNPYLGRWTKQERVSLIRNLNGYESTGKLGASRAEREMFLSQFEKSNRKVAQEFLGIEGPLFDHPILDDAPDGLNLDDAMARIAIVVERLKAHL